MKGLGVYPNSSITYEIGGRFSRLTAVIGLDIEPDTLTDQRKEIGRLLFRVKTDGETAYESPMLMWDSPPREIEVEISGANRLTIETICPDWRTWDANGGCWGDLKILRN